MQVVTATVSAVSYYRWCYIPGVIYLGVCTFCWIHTCEDNAALSIIQKLHNEVDWNSATLHLYSCTIKHIPTANTLWSCQHLIILATFFKRFEQCWPFWKIWFTLKSKVKGWFSLPGYEVAIFLWARYWDFFKRVARNLLFIFEELEVISSIMCTDSKATNTCVVHSVLAEQWTPDLTGLLNLISGTICIWRLSEYFTGKLQCPLVNSGLSNEAFLLMQIL